MRLEMSIYNVEDIRFGENTSLQHHILSINREEILALIQDDRFSKIDLEIARCGERTRIVNIMDILEPRAKAGGTYFPGWVGPLSLTGFGNTQVLKGLAILEVCEDAGFIGGIIDMIGMEGMAPFSILHNLAVITRPTEGADQKEYAFASKMASLKATTYLARVTTGLDPDEVKIFKLPSIGEFGGRLPKVAYLCLLHNHGDLREPFVYGDNPRKYFPTVMHPNEMLDGAIICGHYNISAGLKNMTSTFLNHPIILGLYRRHGKDLDFVGVVIANEPVSLKEKERSAVLAAKLIREILGADGVIITKEGGGHTDIDMMQNCEVCEKLGVKTVLIDNEMLSPDGSGIFSLLDFSPMANAIISVGNIDEIIELPEVDRVIGGGSMVELSGNFKGCLRIPVRMIPNAISQAGFTRLTTEER
jgi:sarcosine reductase